MFAQPGQDQLVQAAQMGTHGQQTLSVDLSREAEKAGQIEFEPESVPVQAFQGAVARLGQPQDIALRQPIQGQVSQPGEPDRQRSFMTFDQLPPSAETRRGQRRARMGLMNEKGDQGTQVLGAGVAVSMSAGSGASERSQA